MGFGLPSIGGKDSMSGSFDELNVPPTLVSFAVDVASENDVVTPEFKKAGNKLVLFAIEKDEYDLPNYEQVKKLYGQIHEAVRNGQIVSSYAIGAAVSQRQSVRWHLVMELVLLLAVAFREAIYLHRDLVTL